jgi:hypothetical protein
MRFANSNAIFPPAELAAPLSTEYETRCRQLCLGAYPSWAEVQARFEALKNSP